MFGDDALEIEDLIEAGLVAVGDEWRHIPKDSSKESVSAVVTESGGLRIGSRGFGNPSRAARFVAGGPRNGWQFWRYLDGQRWVPIDELRKQLRRCPRPPRP